MDQEKIKALLAEGSSVEDIMDHSSQGIRRYGLLIIVISFGLVIFLFGSIHVQGTVPVPGHLKWQAHDQLIFVPTNPEGISWTSQQFLITSKEKAPAEVQLLAVPGGWQVTQPEGSVGVPTDADLSTYGLVTPQKHSLLTYILAALTGRTA